MNSRPTEIKPVGLDHSDPNLEVRRAFIEVIDGLRLKTSKAQRIAVAKAYGWTDIGPMSGDLFGVPPKGHIDEQAHQLPDYLNDLNAVKELEETFDADELALYAKTLARHHPTYCVDVLDKNDREGDFWYETGVLVTATAAQRVEAILRMKGLWEDDK